MSDLIETMATKNSNPITGITLEGFQVFDKPTYIPLDSLTLLFGPNSAGKSAVQDALELYGQLLNIEKTLQDATFHVSKNLYGDRSGFFNDAIPALVARHWRRVGVKGDLLVPNMSITVAQSVDIPIASVVARELQRELLVEPTQERPHQLENRWSFVHDEEDNLDFSFDLFIDSELFVGRGGTGIRVNLLHPIFRNIESKVDFAKVAMAYPNVVTLEDGHFTISVGIYGFHPSGRGFLEKGDRWLTCDRYYRAESNQSDALLYLAVAEISLLVGCLLGISNNRDFHPITVQASRTVPTRGDLTYFELGDSGSVPMQQELPKGDPRYELLVDSLISIENRELADGVNRALSDHLFLDQAYRLDFDLRILLSEVNSKAVITGGKIDLGESGHLVELFLRDGKGRKHLFEDVGSGIGYLLPVLCAVFYPSTFANPCFIQQPELHLHPALQAAMGDVFIEARNADKQVLIETHSEHLLLRILKRIRQTHLQASIAPELKINADDVCVLYFNPSPDGSTTVKRLRITEDGEFMDRWPRGFFGERDQELLDE